MFRVTQVTKNGVESINSVSNLTGTFASKNLSSNIFDRKKLLYDEYRHLLSTKPLILVTHNIPMKYEEDKALKDSLGSLNFRKYRITSSIMRMAILDELISKKKLQLNKEDFDEDEKIIMEKATPLSIFFNSNITSILVAEDKSINPKSLKGLFEAMNKRKSPFTNKVLVMGMILENDLSKVYSLDDINKLKESYTMEENHALLVQLLQQQSSGIVKMLESNTTNLSQLLTTYKNEVLGESSK
ncbi:uncharacterized protein HGUI_03737 [Hanseniaspora guilliermondii]|uniref:54S ribosomal protein L11, mitochondrial n=1 Tax=Hanseniaspora guilliermondii TaxID=56406 RepID=A0A1L0B4S8_9ASCO|nr:uncharacterized protein HGUI_03737 [Hanseniaspora guilliermondii]